LSTRTRLSRWSHDARGRPIAHFIHIGKTAGTAVSTALRASAATGDYKIMMQPHGVRLADLPADDSFFFVVRDPVSRFVSGFLSRQRQGKPTGDSPWRPWEAEAFSLFGTADALGRALGAGGEAQQRAEQAMRAISHVNRSYWYWFGDEEHLRKRAGKLLWIGRQESLDLASLAVVLGLGELVLPSDSKHTNRAPAGSTPTLSAEAAASLRHWYRRDYEFLAFCEQLQSEGLVR